MVTEAQAATLKAYDAIAPLYAEYSQKYRRYLDTVDQMVIDRLTPGCRLLDVGSGDGRRLKKIAAASQPSDVVAVEPSGEMANLCRLTTGFPVHQLFGDALGTLPQSNFDAITALWNVFGHIPGSALRLQTLQCMKLKLAPRGSIMLDVNNRHNQRAYGRLRVWQRRVVDLLAFDETRADSHYVWKIGNESFPASGHLFTPAEMDRLIDQAQLHVAERWSVNYGTGEISPSPHEGQLFYRLVHR